MRRLTFSPRRASQTAVGACVLALAFSGPAVAASSAPAASVAGSSNGEGGMAISELERLLIPLGSPDIEKRRAAVSAVSGLNQEATRAIALKLADLRKPGNEAAVRDVLRAARDANSVQSATDAFDLLDAVTRLPSPDTTPYRITLTTLCLSRALQHIGTTPAIRQLLTLSADHAGAFRNEVTRITKDLGERAIAAYIEARLDHSMEIRRFASNQLEAMDKKLPGQAVQTKSNQVLADVLHAYGAIHDMDAVSVVLSFVSSDRTQVRAAARESLTLYGQDAIWKLREAYTNLIGKSAPDAWSADQVARELFAAYDRFRLQEVYALFAEGLAKQKEGNLLAAVEAFDKVLARQPMLDRRAEMVAAYVAYGQSVEDADKPKALSIFRKAARLDPEGSRAGQIASSIAYLEGEDLLARGIADSDIFRRALALDAGNAKGRAELDRLEANAEARHDRLRRWSAAGAIVAAAIAGIVMLGGRRRRQTTARA